jgi:hypothetical protein
MLLWITSRLAARKHKQLYRAEPDLLVVTAALRFIEHNLES